MAYDPFRNYNVTDPYGVTPQQRLARSLAGSTRGSKRVKRDYEVDRYDLGKAYKKQVPQMLSNYARRGMEVSGVKDLGLAEAAGAYSRQMAERGAMLDDALMQIAMDRMGAYGDYFGTRLEDTLDSNVERAATAARIREALN
tara:strand:+ start:264 stop:689 length:426 start_codon:yes stop_codon:yes gene_type:complete